jgi:hypothetical protein
MDGQIGPSSSMEDLVTLRREVEAASLEGAWGCAPKGGEGRGGMVLETVSPPEEA